MAGYTPHYYGYNQMNSLYGQTQRIQNTPRQAFENSSSAAKATEAGQSSTSCWIKTLIGVGIFFGISLVAAAIIIPIWISTLSSTIATTIPTTITTTDTTTTTTDTTTTTTTSSTVVTMYIPSNYWTACTSTCINVTTTTPSTLLASWKFENNLLDSTSSYHGSMTTGTTYIVGFVNQGLSVLSAQYMTVSSYLSLVSRSFTVEAWILVTSLSSSVDYGIFGQCQTIATRQCLHYIIRSSKLYFAFYGDDVSGSTNVPLNVWVHAAFVYDLTTNTKSIYLNGILDGSITSGSSYQGTSGVMYVGYATHSGSVTPLPGYIDQVTISNRAKTACEILNDATLTSRFSFQNTIADTGPNVLPSYSTVQGNSGVSYVAGPVNQSLMLSRPNAFFQSCSYYWLGRAVNQPFSFALWINPTAPVGTILHLSSDRSGSGGWCLPKLGFSSNGSIVAQSWRGSVVSIVGPQLPTNNWTHIVETWSVTNGLRLYVNGDLYGSATMTTFSSTNGISMCLFLGTSGFGTNCQTTDIVPGSYSGAIDEFYVYSKELTPAEVCALAHP